jgi:cyclic beta-1,2-glucan synthetase
MYQAAIDGLLGLRRHGSTFSIEPSIPAMWPKFSIQWRVGQTRYHVLVLNPDHHCMGVRSARLDGASVDHKAIPLFQDGATHNVVVELGAPAHAPSSVLSKTGAEAERGVG